MIHNEIYSPEFPFHLIVHYSWCWCTKVAAHASS